MRNILIVLCSITLFCSSGILAQKRQVRFDKISVDEGVPEGNILDIKQDSKGYIWICSYEGLFKHNGRKIIAADLGTRATSLTTNRATCIAEDKDGDLWVGTYIGLNRIACKTGKIIQYKNTGDSLTPLPGNRIFDVFVDTDNDIWINTDNGIAKYSKGTNQFEQFPYSDSSLFTYCIFEDRHSRIWISTSKGLLTIDKHTGNISSILDTNSTETIGIIVDIYRDKANQVWLCSTTGLFILNEDSLSIKPATLLPQKYRETYFRRIVQDNNSDYWLSTSAQLFYYNTQQREITIYKKEKDNPESLLSARVRELYLDNSGNVWIGTDIGLNKTNPQSEAFNFYQLYPYMPYNDYSNHVQRVHQNKDGSMLYYNYTDLYYAKNLEDSIVKVNGLPKVFIEHLHNMPNGETWLSYTAPGSGVWKYQPGKDYAEKVTISENVDNVAVYQFQTDIDSPWICWIATKEDLIKYNIKTKRTVSILLKHIQSKSHPSVQRFLQSRNGKLWIAAGSNLLLYDKNTQDIKEFTNNTGTANRASSHVRDLVEGADGNIWFATQSGLSFYDNRTKSFNTYTTKNGLVGGNIVYSIAIDKKGKIWFTTFNHIISLDPKSEQFSYYTQEDGIHTTFNRLSCCNRDDGIIVFGGTNGIVAFHPDSIRQSNSNPPVVICSIAVNNKPYESNVLAEYQDTVRYSYSEGVITIDFSVLEYVSDRKNVFSYKMQGFDKDWIDAGTNNKATYTNLNPGTYTFIVRASNYSGAWSNKTAKLTVVVAPLFWQTWWFKILILVAVIILLYYLWHSDNQKRKLQQEKTLAIQKDKYKSQFLSNVSHEIRTPLNAIIGLNKLLLDTPLNKQQYKYTHAAVKSSQTLFTLINDLLDQAKIESGQFSINNKPFNPNTVLDQVYNTFLHNAQEKGLYLKLNVTPLTPENVLGDAVRLHQILSNLVSNAIKYTKVGGIEIITNAAIVDNKVEILFEVKDTGIGIEDKKLKTVFESFKQVDNSDNATQIGTGLGLSICKQLVELQGGYIYIDSVYGKGSSFKFMLAYDIPHIASEQIKIHKEQAEQIEQLKVLLVEDTPFNQLLTIEILKKGIAGVTVIVAENGKEALELLSSRKDYQIILMDVKMPIMNGYEASIAIRNMDEQYYKTIPILALTANAIPEQLEKCKQSGMNDWVTKPIDDELLLSKISILTKIKR